MPCQNLSQELFEKIIAIWGLKMKRALLVASVASMVDQFNMQNIRLLKELGYHVDVACNFVDGNTCSLSLIHI